MNRPNRFRLRLIAGVLLAGLLLTGCGSDSPEGVITASGFIEGEEVVVAAETSGRIAEVVVDRGDRVAAGDVLVRLDDATLQSNLLEAEAGLAAARAHLAQVEAGARVEEIAAAEAALAQAEAQEFGAAQAVINAREAISSPLQLNADIDGARTQVRLAEQNLEKAEADLARTELEHELYTGKGTPADENRAWDLRLQAARSAVDEAQANLEGAQAYLNVLYTIRNNPLRLESQLHQAQTEYATAQAGVLAARAELEQLEAGPTAEEVAIAQAGVHQAEANVALIEARIDRLTLTAPLDGVVSTRSAQQGETASPGVPLLTLANLDEVTLVIYIPENRIGQVSLGQAVEVEVDSFPERTFTGHVASIAGEAEFTPRNVQTQEERVNLVFAVDVSIPNPDHELKPGMPADATLRP
jgi:multidrug resistance efflux pump